MPLTNKGKKIMRAMKSQYGSEEGKKVFYASKNKGTIKGVEDETQMNWQNRIYENLVNEDEVSEGLATAALGALALGTAGYGAYKVGKGLKKAEDEGKARRAKKAADAENAVKKKKEADRKGRWSTDVATGVDPLYKKELEHKRGNPNPTKPRGRADIEASLERLKRKGR